MMTKNKNSGFTLTEMAISLAIISLVAGGLMYAFSSQFKNTKYKESAASLIYAKKALLNFVELNGYLPCPDTDGDGKENRSGSACSDNKGTLPYMDIGLSQGRVKDSWGNLIRYNVVANVINAGEICSTSPTRYSANYFCNVNPPVFDSRTPPTATATDSNNLDILDASGGNTISSQMSVILVATNSNGGRACADLSLDEQENCDGDQVFVQHDRTDNPFFDDLLITISGYEIKRPQQFTAASFSSPPIFLSKFKNEHTKLYNAMQQYNAGEESLGTAWVPRLVAEDQRLFDSERLMIYDNACAVEPEVFLNPDNYSTLPAVASTVTLNTDTIKANLKVTGDIQPSGIVTGGDEDNTLYVADNMYGKIQLGNGQNTIVIAGKSAGDIVSGDHNDSVRICQAAEQASIEQQGDTINAVEFEFYANRIVARNEYDEGKNYWWRYEHVARNVEINGQTHDIDAIVQLVDYSDGFYGMCPRRRWWRGRFCLEQIDNERSGAADAIQPVYRSQDGLRAPQNFWLDFRVTFYKHGTNEPIVIPRFYATTLDMDGWEYRDGSDPLSRQFEYGFFFDTNNFTLNDPTELRPYNKRENFQLTDYIDGNTVKVIASDPVDTGVPMENGEPSYPFTMITTQFSDTSSFKYRMGIILEEDLPHDEIIYRINSTWFGTPNYTNAQTITVDGTLDLGSGDDELLVGGNIDRDTYLGDGNNYAYFFSNSRQKVVGTDADDFVTALGDIGWPEPEPNALGWDLRGGNNSVRIKGSCYAPVTVLDGDDIFIVSADTARECAVVTNGGNDLILIDGTLNTLLDSGDGNDFAIVHATTSTTPAIQLGNGDDTLIIETALQTEIYAGDGDDRIVLEAGAGSSVNTINGGTGDDTLIINMTREEWDNSNLSRIISGIETVKLLDAQISLSP